MRHIGVARCGCGMRAFVVLLVALTFLAAPAFGSGTRSESATYFGSVEPTGFCGFPVNKGCAVFRSEQGDTGVTVVANDALGLPVSIFACQDLVGGPSCVDAGDVMVSGCGSVALGAAQGFAAGRDVTVTLSLLPKVNAIILQNSGGCDLPAPVTTGTIVATFTTA